MQTTRMSLKEMYHIFEFSTHNLVENLTLRQRVSTKKKRTPGSPRFVTPGFQSNVSDTNNGDFEIEDMNYFEHFEDVRIIH